MKHEECPYNGRHHQKNLFGIIINKKVFKVSSTPSNFPPEVLCVADFVCDFDNRIVFKVPPFDFKINGMSVFSDGFLSYLKTTFEDVTEISMQDMLSELGFINFQDTQKTFHDEVIDYIQVAEPKDFK